MQQFHRHFTPDEANAALTELVPIVEEIVMLVHRARAASAQDDPDAQASVKERIDERVKAIEAQGAYLKGLDPALLDFPALRNGAEVFLCWRQGERKIDHWHPVSTGVAGRKALASDDPGWWEWAN